MISGQKPKNWRLTGLALPTGSARRQRGFTLLELLLVLFIVGLIAAIAAPNVTASITRAKEAALAEDLSVMRRAIDAYQSDQGGYPEALADLVEAKYLRRIPDDPFNDEQKAWAVSLESGGFGIFDVHSASMQTGLNNVPYSEW